MSSVFPEQSFGSSPPDFADGNVRASACATNEPLVPRSDPSRIKKDALGVPALQTYATSLDDNAIHTSKLSNNVSEENGKLRTTRYSKPSVTNIESQMASEVQSLQQKYSSSLPVHKSTAAAQIFTAAQQVLTHETSKEASSAHQPSKEIIKISTDEDDRENFDNIEYVKVLPCVGAFTVQCALCMKWRLIPTKEQYEEIRQSVFENPFFCRSAATWRPDVSCEDPSDVLQDEKHLWAIDGPNIPVAPAGWERQIVIRAAGASKFADVYYVAPSGRKLRSMPDVERFLAEFPEYIQAGVRHSQFSFIIPRPLDANYCRKKATSKNKQAQAKKLSVKRKAIESRI